MLVWNDLEADEKIKVYDKGVKVTSREGVYNLLVNYRSGDMWAPRLEPVEALRLELGYFVECITKNQAPFNDGLAGFRVVKMLEAADQSLRNRGAAVHLQPGAASLQQALRSGRTTAAGHRYGAPQRQPLLRSLG